MAKFEEVIKDSKVLNHPLLSTYRNLPKIRAELVKHAQESNDLSDIFSIGGPLKGNTSLNLRNAVHEASKVLNDVLCQFDLPMFPKVSYERTRDVKYARNDSSRIVSGQIIFNVEFMSPSRVKRIATIPISVSSEGVITPSVMEVSGKTYLMSQKAIDDVLAGATSTYLPPIRNGFDPPLSKEDREAAVATRNEIGWQPRSSEPGAYMGNANRTSKRRQPKKAQGMSPDLAKWYKQYQAQGMDENEALDKAMETVEKLTASKVEKAPISSMKSSGLFGNKYKKIPSQKMGPGVYGPEDFDQEVYQEKPLTYDEEEDLKDIGVYGKKLKSKKQAVYAVPSAYTLVKKDLEEAEKKGEDTFPRIYEHLLRHYILNHVSTASKDEWMIPLINDGFCLNPYGTNVRSRKAFKSWEEFERHQAQVDAMEKEIDMEVDGPVVEPKYYRETKTPIEASDPVKFPGHGGPMKGTIVEIDEEGDFIIVKSKGLEYRVEVDSIEPLPSTFKKMYI